MSRSPASAILVGLLLAASVFGLAGCSPPQVLDDEEAYKAVDALWTAVTARKPELLDAAAGTLERLHSENKLSEAGMTSLKSIIDQARGGEWEPAAKRLKTFIRGQRRKRP